MAQRVFATLAELSASIGLVVGPTAWGPIDQSLINRFADDTGDHNWVHVDPERATAAGYESTIAHGFLTLSLIGAFSPELIAIEECPTTINYGLDRVRFPAPCPRDSRVRATAEILRVEEVRGGGQLTLRYVIEREGSDKPVCVADQLSRRMR
ncbi:MaoC family dehydratase [Prauserella endophytica]|uniref:MaoC family dehydratase n=1 Tax=Prauserella endophytica TaxID=1592324 RepID=A0ABY2RVD7_9PSEU|nr:MaoC family dehydratase [Prauserella endophytica]TKG62045.1 MaoC family dehydratase [Prauserella endophytica]